MSIWVRKDSIRQKSERLASFAVATRTSNAVNVSFNVVWEVVVDNDMNIVDILKNNIKTMSRKIIKKINTYLNHEQRHRLRRER